MADAFKETSNLILKKEDKTVKLEAQFFDTLMKSVVLVY